MAQPQDPPVRKYQAIESYDEIENVEDYEPGGYHPVNLFDVLDGRFEIVYKLGFGGIAMVWLCYETDAERWRAVKINAASHSSEDCAELRMLETFREKNITAEALSAMHIVVPYETFWIEGPNGRHLCSVMPVLGPRLSEWREGLALDYDTVDKMCYQFTEGLGYLHSLGIAHGDFRPANILTKFKPQSLDNISVDEMKYLLDAPEYLEVLTMDGERSIHAPDEIVTGVPWNRLRHLVSNDVAIVDFGESYRFGDPPSTMGIPIQYGAPEVVFGATPTSTSDIWSLAYTLIEFRLMTSLPATVSATVWRMERFAGAVPLEFRPAAIKIIEESRGKPLDIHTGYHDGSEDQKLRPITEKFDALNAINDELAEGSDYTCPLEILLGAEYWIYLTPPEEEDGIWSHGDSGSHRIPSHEVHLFADLLRRMFKYSPEDRLGASKALKHPWFRRTQADQISVTKKILDFLLPLLLVGLCLLSSWLVWTHALPTLATKETSTEEVVEICFITIMDIGFIGTQ